MDEGQEGKDVVTAQEITEATKGKEMKEAVDGEKEIRSAV